MYRGQTEAIALPPPDAPIVRTKKSQRVLDHRLVRGAPLRDDTQICLGSLVTRPTKSVGKHTTTMLWPDADKHQGFTHLLDMPKSAPHTT